jgi:hypothetical protein
VPDAIIAAVKKGFLAFALSAAIAAGIVSCKKGSSPSGPSNPGNTGGFSSTPAVAGQPAELDLAKLAARFGTIGAEVLQQTLSGSTGTASVAGTTAQSVRGGLALTAPTSPSTVGAFFLCCTDTASTSLQVSGSVGAATTGSVPVSLTYSTTAPLQWTGVNSGASWNLTFQSGTITLSGTLTTVSGAIGPNQQLTLAGALLYSLPGSSTNLSLPVSLTFTYPDLSAAITNDAGASLPVTTSGTVGSLQLASSAVPSVSMTGRCSAPKEGCGAGASGSCPCTKWPPCPSYGLSCSGSFK